MEQLRFAQLGREQQKRAEDLPGHRGLPPELCAHTTRWWGDGLFAQRHTAFQGARKAPVAGAGAGQEAVKQRAERFARNRWLTASENDSFLPPAA